jgi:hypothetical protein
MEHEPWIAPAANAAIEAHDKANPNHRFVTALNRKDVA